MVILHGGPALPFYTKSLAKKLSEKYPVIDVCFRSRIHTQSPPPFDMKTHRSDLLHLLTTEIEQKNKKCILIGHSFGGLMAASFVSRNPQLPIESLILICPAPADTPSREIFMRHVEAKWSCDQKERRQYILREMRDPEAPRATLWNEYWKLLAPTYFFDPSLADQIRWADWDFEAFDECLKSAGAELQEQSFILRPHSFDKPVLIVGAENDPCPIDSNYRWIQSHFAKTKLLTLKECGHFPWLEAQTKAQEFYSLLLDLLEQKNT